MKFHMALPFVVAIIKNDKGKILIGQIPDQPHKPYPLLWDLPAGKLENNETPEECLIREVKEETGFTLTNMKLVGIFHHSDTRILKECKSNIPSLGICYEVETAGTFKPTEMDNMQFMDLKKINKLKMTPWTKYFVELIC